MELNQGPISGITEPTESTPPASGTSSQEGPQLPSGQAQEQGPAPEGQATVKTEGTPKDEVFSYDMADVPEELKPVLNQHLKSLQAAATKKFQAIAKDRQKIEAYDAFSADPVGQLQRMASQYGMTLTRAQAQAEINRQQDGEEWAPKSWDDVFSRSKEIAKQEILRELAPMLQGVQKLQAGNIEAQLDKLDSNWRMYEDEMRQQLSEHPTLVKDVGKLYRLSVPEEVWTARATQEALKKLQAKTEAAHVGGKSSTSKSAPATMKINSFADAVAAAKRQLAEGGGR